MHSVPPSPTNSSSSPADIECPYIGLPFAHLKLNKNVLIVQENTKISGKKSPVTCAFLSGCWLLYYPKPNALKPSKYFLVDRLDAPTNADQALDLTVYCQLDVAPQTLHFDSGSAREMWVKVIRDELPILEDGVYDDPNNLRMDDHLYKTLKFDYDIPKMPPKPIVSCERQKENQPVMNQQQRMSSNRTEFQLKYQEIKEQLASQLKQPKNAGGAVVVPRSNSIASPQKKFGRFISMFRSSTAVTGNQEGTGGGTTTEGVQKKSSLSSPDKVAKIMKCKRNTTIFSPDYEIVGS